MSTVRMDRLGAADAALLEKDTQWICNDYPNHKFSKNGMKIEYGTNFRIVGLQRPIFRR